MMTEFAVETRTDIVFAEHDGMTLLGDLYRPKGRAKAPVLVALHGGGWQLGDRKFYRDWGGYLARHGYALFATEYRLMKPGASTWPGVVCDCRAAVQFVRGQAAELGVDPDRVGLIGDSAGAHLAALVALAGDEPLFLEGCRNDPYASIPTHVTAVIGFYGVYDMLAQWEHDQITRPLDPITEKLLGGPPMKSRKRFFEASPISYATIDKNKTRFLLIYGREDDIVNPATQSERFLTALKQAGFFARTIVVPGAGHFWSVDPVEEPGSFGAYAGPKMLRFLATAFPQESVE
ncbi:MAG TPA: alpha/beta hydrolase [Stellaceae bacterium]|jgi:acetyl esterase/lipase